MEDLSFEEMFNKSLVNDTFSCGSIVKGIILQISDDIAFVDIKGKSEAIIDIKEVVDKNGDFILEKNHEYDFIISNENGNEIELTNKPGLGFLSWELLKLYSDNNLFLYGKITGVKEAGFSVMIGDYTAFCPLTHLEKNIKSDHNYYLNRVYDFKILDLKSPKNIVVSRREIITENIDAEIEKLKNSLKIGDSIETKVTRIEEFGIFVEMGPFEGLVHRSELSLSRLVQPESFKPDETVKVQVKEIDWENSKFSLSIKSLYPDPWTDEIKKYNDGDKLSGTVTKLIKQGVFVEIHPGIEGFIPVSRLSYNKRITSPEQIVKEYQKIDVKIVEINKNEKKILLENVSEDTNPWESNNSLENKTYSCIIEKLVSSGAICRIENGMEGFIPKSEFDGNSLKVDDRIDAGVLEFDREGRKLILSPVEAQKIKELSEMNNYLKNEKEENSSNTLGSMFKDVFDNLKDI